MSVTRILGVVLLLSGISAGWLLAPDTNEVAAFSGQESALDQSGFRDEADVALARWAFDRFDQAGLELPPLSLSFHDDRTECEGHLGYFRPGTPPSIDICGFNWNRFLVTPKKTILHELAHAWSHQTLDSETRNQFLDARGLDTWQDDSVTWEEQGIEHAAEVIAWGLIDEDLLLTTIGETDSVQLAAAFELLTGKEPLR
jgi:hypothetical protein